LGEVPTNRWTKWIAENPLEATVKVTLKSFPFGVVVLRPEFVKSARLTTPCPSQVTSGVHRLPNPSMHSESNIASFRKTFPVKSTYGFRRTEEL
jgi:hypothetical protein